MAPHKNLRRYIPSMVAPKTSDGENWHTSSSNLALAEFFFPSLAFAYFWRNLRFFIAEFVDFCRFLLAQKVNHKLLCNAAYSPPFASKVKSTPQDLTEKSKFQHPTCFSESGIAFFIGKIKVFHEKGMLTTNLSQNCTKLPVEV